MWLSKQEILIFFNLDLIFIIVAIFPMGYVNFALATVVEIRET